MTNLRFKDYTFRHNPRKITVKYQQKVVPSLCYDFGQAVQQLGKGLTIVEGEGELFGPDAMEQFIALRKLAQQEGSGILSGAGLDPMKAVFEQLQMVGRGGDQTITYIFRFLEERSVN